MNKRLKAQGITTVQQLCAMSKDDMHNLWAGLSVNGSGTGSMGTTSPM